jgi:hypothetical protein
MKWKVAGFVMCFVSLIGCNDDVEKPQQQEHVALNTPGGTVFVQDVIRNLDEQRFTAAVAGGGINATLELEAMGDGMTTTGAAARLLDSQGHLLYSMETSMNSSTGEVTITHATPDDYLTVSVIADDERVYERYDVNGDVAVFEYPALSDDTQRRAVNYYEHGLPAARLPHEVSQYVGQVGAFDTYYAPHKNSTLYDNPNGKMLVELLSSGDMANMVVGDTDPASWGWLGNVCVAARGCMLLVCRLSPSSMVCWVCWAISVACTFASL